jgi:hypothetical protein
MGLDRGHILEVTVTAELREAKGDREREDVMEGDVV